MPETKPQFQPHNHTFGQDRKRPGEARTITVIAITGTMMVVEIVTGIIFGSMALLADGLHMASHTAALGINVFAYVYARRHAHDHRYSFGTGKVNALGGFTGAVLLAIFALIMAGESIERIINPVDIAFNQAILVAVAGLIVNGASVKILGLHRHYKEFEYDEQLHNQHHDHNLRAAYLHVLADALTSILAIIALVSAKYTDLIWMDPVVGITGAILVSVWAFSLLRSTGHLLLDRQGPDDLSRHIRETIEQDGDSQVVDLHVWSVGPGIYSAIVSVAANKPKSPDEYKRRLPPYAGLVHVTIEVHARKT